MGVFTFCVGLAWLARCVRPLDYAQRPLRPPSPLAFYVLVTSKCRGTSMNDPALRGVVRAQGSWSATGYMHGRRPAEPEEERDLARKENEEFTVFGLDELCPRGTW